VTFAARADASDIVDLDDKVAFEQRTLPAFKTAVERGGLPPSTRPWRASQEIARMTLRERIPFRRLQPSC
jgi:hypothetical protein